MENRNEFIKRIQEKVTLVAVSKNRSREEIEQLYHEGILFFGENKVQQLISKAYSNDLWQWHFIGHLQTNKVKDVVSLCSLIHSVDSVRLLNEINKQAGKIDKVMDVLIQINLSDEATKYGCKREEVEILVVAAINSKNVRLRGIMVMGPLSEDKNETEKVFKEASEWFVILKKAHPFIDICSMGMSGDYNIAIENGSTMVRIGTLLFEWD
ncbi:MAG: YggS family pyridoxal phosphate-dependent enzyme [Firmicutes bacterium HGW-Firmicutes-19]|jgi:PLP dependent protein|nr:MAG: YggS family pyridoxal phosphate-dependent enzyme [Firmicutes bacterium HGW-Firmicutes-19]